MEKQLQFWGNSIHEIMLYFGSWRFLLIAYFVIIEKLIALLSSRPIYQATLEDQMNSNKNMDSTTSSVFRSTTLSWWQHGVRTEMQKEKSDFLLIPKANLRKIFNWKPIFQSWEVSEAKDTLWSLRTGWFPVCRWNPTTVDCRVLWLNI